MRRILLSLFCVLLLATLGAGVYVRSIVNWRSPESGPPVRITVGDAEPFRQVARRLEAAGLVRDARVFTWLARLRGLDRRVRSGPYDLPLGKTAEELLDVLASGQARVFAVTVPEGLTVDETADVLERAGLGSASSFRCLASDAAFLESLDLPGGHLEGYLFPDTYSFRVGAGPAEILSRMARRFFEVFTTNDVDAAAAQGLTVDQAVTLASLIEKEAAVPAERGLVSAVFHNRLAKGMLLQSDPTAVYGVEGRKGEITHQDLARRSPYNTYLNPGLPPGPIANPGREAIEAALHPTPNVKALYFVSRNDRTHEFNETLEAHQRAVDRYQRRRAP
ncbi:MAG TPA: endolytic transglycosylase MltG [Candidatus Bathyarchaeia archaeon]|nr:endolytic transglycosylase MltG [Candidatus Bathyarchaeia archaeon]